MEKNTDTKLESTVKYSVNEIVACTDKIFGLNVKEECVLAAFKTRNIKTATVNEAKEIVNEFLKKEVN